MIKKLKSEQYNEIKHIISELYKIKTINRRSTYTTVELRRLVMKDQHGKNVLDNLMQGRVTSKWLLVNRFPRVQQIFNVYLDQGNSGLT